jgi:hypothetical protein
VVFYVEDAAVHDFRSLGASMCLAQSLVVALGGDGVARGYCSTTGTVER